MYFLLSYGKPLEVKWRVWGDIVIRDERVRRIIKIKVINDVTQKWKSYLIFNINFEICN